MLSYAALVLLSAVVSGTAATPPAPAAEPAKSTRPPKQPPDVLAVSDVFGHLPEKLRPSPGKPVFYDVLGKTERDLGAPIAGEPRADPAEIEREVVKVLASQGFVRTKVGGPMPSIAIILTWGSANLDSLT